MARRKTTVYLDPDLLTATKVLAASSGRREYEVIEDALRAYMRAEETAESHRQLLELLARVHQRSDLTEDEAMKLAVEEVHAVRSERAARR